MRVDTKAYLGIPLIILQQLFPGLFVQSGFRVGVDQEAFNRLFHRCTKQGVKSQQQVIYFHNPIWYFG
jgi:hypothetical protein